MVFDLTASTDAGRVAVFDPAALTELRALPAERLEGEGGAPVLSARAARGDLFLFSPGVGGTYLLRCFVDERPPAEALEGAETRFENLLLRLPGGRLCAGGIEALPAGDRPGGAPAPPAGSSREVPPGDYRLEAYSFFRPPRPEGSEATRAAGCAIGCLAMAAAPLLGAYAVYSPWWGATLAGGSLLVAAALRKKTVGGEEGGRPPSACDLLLALTRRT